jgi:hypothetical protein
VLEYLIQTDWIKKREKKVEAEIKRGERRKVIKEKGKEGQLERERKTIASYLWKVQVIVV